MLLEASAPFKIGELVKVIGGSWRIQVHRSESYEMVGSFAIIASEYYLKYDEFLRVDVLVESKIYTVSPYDLERVNND